MQPTQQIKTIKIKDFSPVIVNRNKRQGDGRHTAEEFRATYLAHLDSEETWDSDGAILTLDFDGVTKMSPSFANEAFGYFMKYAKASPDLLKKKIVFINMSNVQKTILETELDAANKKC